MPVDTVTTPLPLNTVGPRKIDPTSTPSRRGEERRRATAVAVSRWRAFEMSEPRKHEKDDALIYACHAPAPPYGFWLAGQNAIVPADCSSSGKCRIDAAGQVSVD